MVVTQEAGCFWNKIFVNFQWGPSDIIKTHKKIHVTVTVLTSVMSGVFMFAPKNTVFYNFNLILRYQSQIRITFNNFRGNRIVRNSTSLCAYFEYLCTLLLARCLWEAPVCVLVNIINFYYLIISFTTIFVAFYTTDFNVVCSNF